LIPVNFQTKPPEKFPCSSYMMTLLISDSEERQGTAIVAGPPC
jgi:hypothetical protein